MGRCHGSNRRLPSYLESPRLPTKPLKAISALVGEAYVAASQAGACLPSVAVLQAYQADLLKDLDEGQEVDISLCATKETARAPATIQLLVPQNSEAELCYSCSPTERSEVKTAFSASGFKKEDRSADCQSLKEVLGL